MNASTTRKKASKLFAALALSIFLAHGALAAQPLVTFSARDVVGMAWPRRLVLRSVQAGHEHGSGRCLE